MSPRRSLLSRPPAFRYLSGINRICAMYYFLSDDIVEILSGREAQQRWRAGAGGRFGGLCDVVLFTSSCLAEEKKRMSPPLLNLIFNIHFLLFL